METTYALNENKTLQEIKRPPRIGFIKTFAGTTPPEGTLLCDGSAVSRDTYSELFDVIGTTWGEGDGTNTFNLPDLRDVWILCAGTEHEAGDSVAEGLPNVTGGFSNIPLATTHGVCWGFWGAFVQEQGPGTDTNAAAPTPSAGYVFNNNFSLDRGSAIYGASDHVTPKSTVLTPCIIYE